MAHKDALFLIYLAELDQNAQNLGSTGARQSSQTDSFIKADGQEIDDDDVVNGKTNTLA